MSEFDDPILRDRLSRYAGAPPDSDAAYVGVQQRVRHVKRRRVAIWSGAAAIVIGVGAANALQGPDGAKVTVPPTASTPVANTVTTSTSTTSTSTTATSTPATTTTAVATTVAASTQPAAPEATNPETALGSPDSGDAATAVAPPAKSATASRPAAPPSASEDDASRNGVGDEPDDDRDERPETMAETDGDRDNDATGTTTGRTVATTVPTTAGIVPVVATRTAPTTDRANRKSKAGDELRGHRRAGAHPPPVERILVPQLFVPHCSVGSRCRAKRTPPPAVRLGVQGRMSRMARSPHHPQKPWSRRVG